jgi:hypothetical protein
MSSLRRWPISRGCRRPELPSLFAIDLNAFRL